MVNKPNRIGRDLLAAVVRRRRGALPNAGSFIDGHTVTAFTARVKRAPYQLAVEPDGRGQPALRVFDN
ncbi:hypothetical protein GCM10023403_16140 [Pseudonocardia benzenivorans]